MKLLFVATSAFADPAGGGPPANPVSWTTTELGLPAIAVDPARGTISVAFKAHLAELTHEWSLLPAAVPVAGQRVVLPLNVPATAWMHPAADDYVTDLLARVDVDGFTWVLVGALSWPTGRLGPPVVWSSDEVAVRAPQGVLRAELRDPLLADGDRIMPDVSDVAPARHPDMEALRAEAQP